MSKKLNKVFMAFATGKESTEGASIKRYIGIGPVHVLAINPTKEELSKLYNGANIDNEPEYLGTAEVGPEGNKKKVNQVRLDFIIKTDPEKCDGIETTTKATFFLRQDYRFNKDQTKVQIIDKYGRTAWATPEEVKSKSIPQYASGPANIDVDYRPAYIGEEELTNFIKDYLNIPNCMNYVNGAWVDKTPAEKAEAEARLDNIDSYFKGDFKELKKIVSYQPNNKVKALFGVKTTADNKQYQAIYTQKFLKNSINDYSKLEKEVQERKAAGAYADTEFEICPLKEYNLEATNFSSTPSGSDDPFATAGFPFGK